MGKTLLLAFALDALAASPAPADPLKVALAQKGFWNSSMFEFARREGFIKESGLDLDITYTQGGATTVQTVISGSVDVAIPTGTLGALSAYVKGAPLRIIAGEMAGVSDIFWYARAGSASPASRTWPARPLPNSSGGSSGHIALLALLAENNIQANPSPPAACPAP